jgi:hypothetical protein
MAVVFKEHADIPDGAETAIRSMSIASEKEKNAYLSMHEESA